MACTLGQEEQDLHVISAYQGMTAYLEEARNDPDASSTTLWREHVVGTYQEDCVSGGEHEELAGATVFQEPIRDLERLSEAVDVLDDSGVEKIIQEAFQESSATLSGPDTTVCIFVVDDRRASFVGRTRAASRALAPAPARSCSTSTRRATGRIGCLTCLPTSTITAYGRTAATTNPSGMIWSIPGIRGPGRLIRPSGLPSQGRPADGGADTRAGGRAVGGHARRPGCHVPAKAATVHVRSRRHAALDRLHHRLSHSAELPAKSPER